MKTVTIKKAKLLGIITKNRTKHRAIFLEALDGWKAECIKEIARIHELAKADKINKSLVINLQKPEDHTREYDRATEMLKLEVSDKVVLSQEEFAHLVQDDWDWKRHFLVSNSRYSSTANLALGGGDDDEGYGGVR